MQILGVDVGGSGIKAAVVDLETGKFVTERFRLETPESFEMEAVTKTMVRLINKFDYDGPVGIGFPAAVANGYVLTPPTAHEVPGWLGKSVDDKLTEATGCDVRVLNDADSAGLAEMRFGAGKDVSGVVITCTLGTGVGGGMFMDGMLVPNLEIGKIYLEGHDEVVELYMAGRIKEEQELSWQEYGQRLNEFCLHVEHVFSPELIIIGGGISKKHAKYLPEVQLKRSKVVPAQLRNRAGIVGAAVWASESQA